MALTTSILWVVECLCVATPDSSQLSPLSCQHIRIHQNLVEFLVVTSQVLHIQMKLAVVVEITELLLQLSFPQAFAYVGRWRRIHRQVNISSDQIGMKDEAVREAGGGEAMIEQIRNESCQTRLSDDE